MDGGTIVDTNTQYTQKHFAEVSAEKKCSKTLMAWKNDRAVSELVLSAANGDFTNVTIQTRDLMDGKKKIAKENVTATFIRSTKAYVYGYVYGNDVPAATEDNRAEASDILWQSTPIDIKADTLQSVWVNSSATALLPNILSDDKYRFLAADGSTCTYFSTPSFSSADYYCSPGNSICHVMNFHRNVSRRSTTPD